MLQDDGYCVSLVFVFLLYCMCEFDWIGGARSAGKGPGFMLRGLWLWLWLCAESAPGAELAPGAESALGKHDILICGPSLRFVACDESAPVSRLMSGQMLSCLH